MTNLATVTRKDLRRLVAGDLGLGRLFTGTASDNGVTTVQAQDTLVDASYDGLKESLYSEERFANAWLYLPTNTAEPRATAEEHRVAYDASLGTLTTGRNFNTTPVTAVTEYEVHTHGLSVAQLHQCLAWALRSARVDAYVTLPGLIRDGDLQEEGVDAWTAVASATVAKALETDDSWTLAVVTTASTDYVTSAAIRVEESRSYRIGARVRPDSGIATLTLFDAGGTDVEVTWASRTQADASDGTAWTHLVGHFTTGAGVGSVTARLGSTGVSEAAWQDLYCYPVDAHEVVLPAWIEDPRGQLVGVYYRQRLAYFDRASHLVPVSTPAPRGRVLPVQPVAYPGPVVVRVAAPFRALSADTDTVPAWAQDWLAAGALKAAYQLLSRPHVVESGQYGGAFVQANMRWTAGLIAHNPVIRDGLPPYHLGG